jgi:hypothetical protein
MICEIISPYLENYFYPPPLQIPFHTDQFSRIEIYENLMEEDQGCFYACVCAHTQQSLVNRSFANSGSQVFRCPVVTRLASDNIWFLICKQYKKIWWHTKRASTAVVSISLIITNMELQLSYSNLLKVNNKSDDFVV